MTFSFDYTVPARSYLTPGDPRWMQMGPHWGGGMGSHWGGGMQWGAGGGWGVGALWPLLALVVVLAVVLGAAYLFVRSTDGGGTDGAAALLRERYARGELTDEEFEERAARLGLRHP